MLSAFFPWKGNRIPTFGGVPKAVSLTRLGVTPLALLTKPQYLLLGKFRFEKQEPTVLLKYKAKLGRKQRSLRVCEQWGCWPLSPSKLSLKHKLAPGSAVCRDQGWISLLCPEPGAGLQLLPRAAGGPGDPFKPTEFWLVLHPQLHSGSEPHPAFLPLRD